MKRYFNPEQCAMIADALATLTPDTGEGQDIRDQLEPIMRDYALSDGVVLSDPDGGI